MSKDDNEQSDQGEQKKGPMGGIKGLLTKLPVLISGVMVLEAALLVGGYLMFAGGPGSADAAHLLAEGYGEGAGEAGEGDGGSHYGADYAEITVDSFRAPNRLDGRTYLYDVEISIRVKADGKETVEKKLASSTALVRDRMNRIVAQIDPQKLNGAVEPGLETLRRQVKYQLDLIVGEGLIEEVLVPQCIPYRTDY